jgi:hypothetical protein
MRHCPIAAKVGEKTSRRCRPDPRRCTTPADPGTRLAETLAWQQHSAGAGVHSPRRYSWAWFRLLAEDDTDTGVHHLLIRRNDTTSEHAYLRCYSPRSVPLRMLVAVAGRRWRIEEPFACKKTGTGRSPGEDRCQWPVYGTGSCMSTAVRRVASSRGVPVPGWASARQLASAPADRSAPTVARSQCPTMRPAEDRDKLLRISR